MRTLVVLVVLAAGCGSVNPGPAKPQRLPIEALRLRPFVSTYDSELDPLPGVQIIRTAAAYSVLRRALDWRADGPQPASRSIDFAKEQVVVISWGNKPSLDFALRVCSVEATPERVLIEVETLAPIPIPLSMGDDENSCWPYVALVVPARPLVDVVVGGDRLAPVEDAPYDEGRLDFAEGDVAIRLGPRLSPASGPEIPTRAYRVTGFTHVWPRASVFQREADYRPHYERVLATGEARVREVLPDPTADEAESQPLEDSVFARVDFNEQQVVVVSFGRKPNTGYGLRLRSVQRDGDALVVEVETTVPGEDDMPEDAVGSPALTLLVPRTPRVELVVLGDRHADSSSEWERERFDFNPGRARVRLAN